MKKVTCFKIGFLATMSAMILNAACSGGFAPVRSSANGVAAAAALSVSPNATSVQPDAQVQLTASGGTGPYKYQITHGSGTVDLHGGLFTASLTQETDSILVTDSAGASVTATVTVASSTGSTTSTATFSATYSPATITAGDTVTLIPSGGTAPYTYAITTGAGTLTGNSYATTIAESVVITMTDSSSPANTITVTFTVNASVVTTAPSVALTNLTAQVPGTTSNICPSGGTLIGTMALIYNGHDDIPYKYAGDYSFCQSTGTPAAGTSVMSDLWLSPAGAHNMYPVCPGGYSTLLKNDDCVGGSCQGYQVLCAAYQDGASSATFISDFYLSNEGAHVNGSCSSGYSTIGVVADCGGSAAHSVRCSGTQALCVKH